MIYNGPLKGRNGGAMTSIIHYNYLTVDKVRVFYREAGAKDAPVLLLLHGFPTSSNMFRNLIPALADKYHLIAPDYPGFGMSDMPDRDSFAYTFAHYTDIVDTLVSQLGIQRYAIYIMDYGAPVGLRLALKHPERVTGLVVQNGNAYEEGLAPFWQGLQAYWASNGQKERDALKPLFELPATQSQYHVGVKDTSRLDPSAWMLDQALLDRPGNNDIQLDLFFDYQNNVKLYPEFHSFFKKQQPPTLVVWGKNDMIFAVEGAEAFKRDNPRVETHLIDSGHFALEDKADEIIPLIKNFLASL